jgi:molybdenum cofactor cytidylyltransferase
VIEGIVLAAGSGRRFGGGKLLASLGERAVLVHVLDAGLGSTVQRIHVVIASGDDETMSLAQGRATVDTRLRILSNAAASSGQMSSLQLGIRSLSATASSALVMLGDMPLVSPELCRQLQKLAEESPSIVIPTKGQRLGHPRVLPRWLFPELMALQPDARGQSILESHGDRTHFLAWHDEDEFLDVDQPADLSRARAIHQRRLLDSA